MEIEIRKILEYEDVFKDEPINIEDVLKKYSREVIIKGVCVLGHSYGNAFWRRTPFFSSNINIHYQYIEEHVTNALNKYCVDDICYSTIKTSLELLRIAFSIPYEAYSNTGLKEDFEYDMFRILLKLNQKLFSYVNEGTLEFDELVYFNQFVTNDTNTTQLNSIFRTQSYYASELFDFLGSYHPSTLSKLLKYWDITDYRQYLLTIYSIFSICYNQQQKNNKGYWLLDFNKIQIQEGLFNPQVAEKLSVNIDEDISYSNKGISKQSDNNDYRTFRSRPLIRVSKNIYYVYNLQLLVERTYNSLFFDLKNVWEGNGFIDFFNKQFVEYNLFRHTMNKCIDKNEYTFPTKKMIKTQPTDELPNQPDFYIRRGASLILFECKAFKLNGDLKDAADLQDLFRVIKLKIYEASENIDKTRKNKKKPEPVGVTQLVTEIEKIEDDNFPFDQNIPDEVYYYPLIVLEDPRLIQPGLMSIVNRWSKKLLTEKIGSASYCPIIITSIDILFQYSSIFRKIGFPRVIDRFIKYIKLNAKLNQNGWGWDISPMADFNAFMADSNALMPINTKEERDKNLKAWFDVFLKKITADIMPWPTS